MIRVCELSTFIRKCEEGERLLLPNKKFLEFGNKPSGTGRRKWVLYSEFPGHLLFILQFFPALPPNLPTAPSQDG
ncbi:uncharacterized protein LOC144312683 isoform X2 [Canis aureus]